MEELTKPVFTRKLARDFTFRLLFAKAFSPDEDADRFFKNELDSVYEMWAQEQTPSYTDVEFGTELDYIRRVYFGVTDSQADIDAKISASAVGWSLQRLTKGVLTIMRLCVYEMTSLDDVPKRVALNEAVELAKKYDDDNAPSFVNGVLNNIAKTLPDRECDRPRGDKN